MAVVNYLTVRESIFLLHLLKTKYRMRSNWECVLELYFLHWYLILKRCAGHNKYSHCTEYLLCVH